MTHELKLKQSNRLILATHRMNIYQTRIFFYLCCQYRGDLKIQTSFTELNRVLNPDQGTIQKMTLEKSIGTMMKEAFIDLCDDEGDEFFKASVFIMAKKRKGQDLMEFEFNPHVAKELESLRNYTWMYLTNLTGMTSTYSVRLYEFFAMRLGRDSRFGQYDFKIQKLREYLDCIEKYSMFKNFEAKVLKQAEKEINSKTNINMSYKKVKTGRNITSITFTFSWKAAKPEDVIDNNVIKKKYTEYTPEELEQLRREIELALSEK